MADSHEEQLAAKLLEAVSDLQQGRLHEAKSGLGVVCDDEALARASTLRDVRARALSLLADVCLQTGDLEGCDQACRQALEILRELGDATGLQQVQQTWSALGEARKQAAAAARRDRAEENLRNLAADDLRRRFGGDALALADVLIKKANAEALQNPKLAATLAEEALALAVGADAVREEVLARLSLARAQPQRNGEHLDAAWRRAERASEFNLVGAVARAADATGHKLPALDGPDLGRETL